MSPLASSGGGSPLLLPSPALRSLSAVDDETFSAQLPPAMELVCEVVPDPKPAAPRRGSELSEQSVNRLACATLGSEQWCHLLCLLHAADVARAMGALLSSAELREDALGDPELWRHLEVALWPSPGVEATTVTWKRILRLISASRSCVRLGAVVASRLEPDCRWTLADDADACREPMDLGSSWQLDNDVDVATAIFDAPVTAVASSGPLIACGSAQDPGVRLLEFANGGLRRLQPLPRRRRGDVALLDLPDRSDLGWLAVAERTGQVRLEDLSGEAADQDVLVWDAVGAGSHCRGLFWLPRGGAICAAWDEGAGLFDADRPEAPVSSLPCEPSLSHCLPLQGNALLLGDRGDLRLWDFRVGSATMLAQPMVGRLTAAVSDPSQCGVAMAFLTESGPQLCHVDLRRQPRTGDTAAAGLSLRAALAERTDDALAKLASLPVSLLSLGRHGELLAVQGGSLLSSFVGGPALRPLSTARASTEITALRAEQPEAPAFVATTARRIPGTREPPWELRLLHERDGMTQLAASPASSPSLRSKPKKFYRKRDAGEEQFRAHFSGRRGR